ncbi:MAG: signal peptide peptidase SppA [Bacteroidales bacterium]|nr:signal peptide peptidase SppA [Bacteroidales bacterium]
MSESVTQQQNKPETRTRKFWRVVFGSMLGFFFSTILVSILYFAMMVGMIASLSSAAEETKTIKDNSILKIDLSMPLSERSIATPLDGMSNYNTPTGLNDILASLKAAANDPKIKGIFLCAPEVSASPATMKEIHDALVNFKKSGKFIYAYSDSYGQNGYYLATTADKIVMNPTGNLLLKGYAFQIMFYKGLLDKLDVDVQVIRHGQFKSAVEPYILDKMSEANNKQMTVLVNSLWSSLSKDIATSRGISVERLNQIVDNLSCFSPDSALRMKLIDQLAYSGDMERMLKNKVAMGENEKLNFVTISNYVKSIKNDSKASDKIAVVYAVGEIRDGKGDNDAGIFSDSFIKEFRKAYKNKDVKAIVLRVNSPGGSAMASENIWREIALAKKAGKIVVTSMGDYAASGGYYISCNSDYIFAQPNTLTGSIGVFGMIPSLQKALQNKLGVTIDGVKSNQHSDFMTGFRAMDESELAVMQNMVEQTYGLFTKRVADGRKMKVAEVDSIGQGRVWAGKDAIAIGLVDKLGSLDDAIAKAAQLAKVSNYKLVYYPQQKSFFEKLFTAKDDEVEMAMKSKLGDLYFMYQGLNQVLSREGVQARMPMEITIQ